MLTVSPWLTQLMDYSIYYTWDAIFKFADSKSLACTVNGLLYAYNVYHYQQIYSYLTANRVFAIFNYVSILTENVSTCND